MVLLEVSKFIPEFTCNLHAISCTHAIHKEMEWGD